MQVAFWKLIERATIWATCLCSQRSERLQSTVAVYNSRGKLTIQRKPTLRNERRARLHSGRRARQHSCFLHGDTIVSKARCSSLDDRSEILSRYSSWTSTDKISMKRGGTEQMSWPSTDKNLMKEVETRSWESCPRRLTYRRRISVSFPTYCPSS